MKSPDRSAAFVFKLVSSLVFASALSIGLSGCASKPKTEAIGDPWFRSARTGDVTMLKGIMQGGGSIDRSTAGGTTALMTASREGSIETVKWLLANGANVRTLDKDDQSALVYCLVGNAPLIKKTRVAEELVAAGADPFLVDKIGFQPVREMLELDMDDQIKKLNFTDKKPCDRLPIRPGEVSISKAARRMEKPELASFLEAQGCW